MRTWVTALVEDLWPWWIVSPLLVYCLHAGWQKFITSVVVSLDWYTFDVIPAL